MKRYKCVECGYPIIDDEDIANGAKIPNNAAVHWRSCVSKRYWPSYMKVKSKFTGTTLDTKESVMFTGKSSTEGVATPGSSVLPDEVVTGTPSLSVEL
jgi:hypothetical protein